MNHLRRHNMMMEEKCPSDFCKGWGLKYRLKSNEKITLFVGIGGMFERENWIDIEDEGMIIKKEIWKASNYINGKVTVNEHVSFNTILYYQGGYDVESETFRSRISGDIVLQMELSQRLAFTTTFTAQYEDEPIIPINNFVYSLTNGLKLSF